MAQARQCIAELEQERDDLLFTAWEYDDKPHHLFNAIKKMAKGHEDEAEICRLMDLAYECTQRPKWDYETLAPALQVKVLDILATRLAQTYGLTHAIEAIETLKQQIERGEVKV